MQKLNVSCNGTELVSDSWIWIQVDFNTPTFLKYSAIYLLMLVYLLCRYVLVYLLCRYGYITHLCVDNKIEIILTNLFQPQYHCWEGGMYRTVAREVGNDIYRVTPFPVPKPRCYARLLTCTPSFTELPGNKSDLQQSGFFKATINNKFNNTFKYWQFFLFFF